ncbi:hypothetical protein FKP32DRAFT_604677 [Trametes sanguinea]|nr:hypothetical protein FKP32DRAFT_604677 [Trametes sanguinea]
MQFALAALHGVASQRSDTYPVRMDIPLSTASSPSFSRPSHGAFSRCRGRRGRCHHGSPLPPLALPSNVLYVRERAISPFRSETTKSTHEPSQIFAVCAGCGK